MINITPIPILSDNYAYLLEAEDGATAIVDPGEAAPIIEHLAAKHIKPDMILITHHHWDHVDGLPDFLAWHECPIYGPAREKSRVKVTFEETLEDGGDFMFGGEHVQIIATPGHTREHLCFYFPESGFVLSADTLFIMGCGRILDGTPEELHASLQKLAALPDETKVYCGHEYTVANAKFCAHIAPDNAAILERLKEVEALREQEKMTIPSTIGREKETNVFLQAKSAAEFATLRQAKDNF